MTEDGQEREPSSVPRRGTDDGRVAPPGSIGVRPAAAPNPPHPSIGFSQVLGRLSTRRAALLALVVCALALSTAVPLRTYLSQRADLRDQLRQQQDLRAQVSQLEQRQARLADPAAAEAEIRTRLRYVMPGETPYVVQLPGQVPTAGQDGSPGRAEDDTWYQQLWNSVVSGRS